MRTEMLDRLVPTPSGEDRKPNNGQSDGPPLDDDRYWEADNGARVYEPPFHSDFEREVIDNSEVTRYPTERSAPQCEDQYELDLGPMGR